MIATAVAIAIQIGATEPLTVTSLVGAVQAWDSCLDAAASKYEPSGEPAGAVVAAALYDCRPLELVAQTALVDFVLGNSDTMTRVEATDRVLAERGSRLRLREQRLTKLIVEARLQTKQTYPRAS